MRLHLSSLVLFSACATAASPHTLPHLRTAINTAVTTPEQNALHSQLAQQASRDKLLQGMTREELESAIGPGEKCELHPLCDEKGFFPDDWYYEVGKSGSYVRYRPALIVGFNEAGKVERTFVLEVK